MNCGFSGMAKSLNGEIYFEKSELENGGPLRPKALLDDALAQLAAWGVVALTTLGRKNVVRFSPQASAQRLRSDAGWPSLECITNAKAAKFAAFAMLMTASSHRAATLELTFFWKIIWIFIIYRLIAVFLWEFIDYWIFIFRSLCYYLINQYRSTK